MEATRRWLRLVRLRPIPPNYVFFTSNQPLLACDEVLDEVRNTIRSTPNRGVLDELPRALAGRKDNQSMKVLLDLLYDPDSDVRYWAADSLKGCTAPQLAERLPELIRNPELRTVALTELAIDNRLDGLHDVYEAWLDPAAQEEWRHTALRYVSAFPRPGDRDLLRSILQNDKDPFLRRSAARGLGRLRDASSVDLILSAMRREPPSDLNAPSYLMALGDIKGEKARRALDSFKTSKIEQVRNLVMRLLNNW